MPWTPFGKCEKLASENGCKVVLIFEPVQKVWIAQFATMANEVLTSVAGETITNAAQTLATQGKLMFKHRAKLEENAVLSGEDKHDA